MRIDGESTMSFSIVAVAEVVRELLDSGIAKNDIILAYNALPFQKLEDLIAA